MASTTVITDRKIRRGHVRSVEKASTILLLIAREGGLSARETAAHLDMPVSTAYQLMETLVSSQILSKDTKRVYDIGPAVGILADAFLGRRSPPEFLSAPLRELAAQTKETVYLTAWKDGDAVILEVLEGKGTLRVAGLHAGTRGDVHARAAGKVLLAFSDDDTVERYLVSHRLHPRTKYSITEPATFKRELRKVRKLGFAVDRQEFSEGVIAISVPVLNDGAVVAAYSLAVPVHRFESNFEKFRAALFEAAQSATRSSRTNTVLTARQ